MNRNYMVDVDDMDIIVDYRSFMLNEHKLSDKKIEDIDKITAYAAELIHNNGIYFNGDKNGK